MSGDKLHTNFRQIICFNRHRFDVFFQSNAVATPNGLKREGESETEEPSPKSGPKQLVGRSLRASASTLNFDAQSVQTASSSNAPRAKRPSRGSLVHAQTLEAQSQITSSTFYNRP